MEGDMCLIHEFKAFVAKGNVVDLAVAVVVGTADDESNSTKEAATDLAAAMEAAVQPSVDTAIEPCHAADARVLDTEREPSPCDPLVSALGLFARLFGAAAGPNRPAMPPRCRPAAAGEGGRGAPWKERRLS